MPTAATLIPEDKRPKINKRQADLLQNTLAFIETHRREWVQKEWRCKTGMCFAGHAAVTFRGGRLVLGLSFLEEYAKASKTHSAERTAEQNRVIETWDAFGDKLYAVPADNPDYVEPRVLDGKKIKVIDIMHRAEKQLGGVDVTTRPELEDVNKGWEGDLFSGDNTLAYLRRHVAAVLGITTAELKRRTAAIAAENGWV